MKKQSNFFDYHKMKDVKRKYGRTCHGGATSRGHRKEQRPLAAGKWIHLVLKSEHAKGAWSFLTPANSIFVNQILNEKAAKFGIYIAEIVNVGNHLHIKCRFAHLKGFQNFLRAVTCLIARKITKAYRGSKLSTPFWQGLAFTRVLKSSFEEMQLKGYFQANREKAAKGYVARQEFLDRFDAWVYRVRIQDDS